MSDARAETDQDITTPNLFGAAALRALRHELRTPINHIIGCGEMLLDEAGDDDLPALVPDLEAICAAGDQLLALMTTASTQPTPIGGSDRQRACRGPSPISSKERAGLVSRAFTRARSSTSPAGTATTPARPG
jgi:signal transduction histidine kinase